MAHHLGLGNLIEIEDPRHHSEEIRERLHHLLVSGAPARPDPKRADIFEIEDHEHVFYIYIAKPSGRVTLLAVWTRDAERVPICAMSLV